MSTKTKFLLVELADQLSPDHPPSMVEAFPSISSPSNPGISLPWQWARPWKSTDHLSIHTWVQCTASRSFTRLERSCPQLRRYEVLWCLLWARRDTLSKPRGISRQAASCSAKTVLVVKSAYWATTEGRWDGYSAMPHWIKYQSTDCRFCVIEAVREDCPVFDAELTFAPCSTSHPATRSLP